MNILITGIHGFVGTNLVSVFGGRHTIYGVDIVFPEKEGVIKTYSWHELEQLPEVDVIILLQLMLKTQSVIWILFLTVYGVDSVCTILHRLYLRQNIFKAHRMHFYQVLTNERRVSHLIVSTGFAVVQLLICLVIISYPKLRIGSYSSRTDSIRCSGGR